MDNVLVPPQDAFSLSKGAVFHDQYEVVRRIDSGAMGTVYEVLDRVTKRRRALKVMLARFVDNPEVIERFKREATVTADVVSEHVVETFDAGVDRETDLPFIVMELLRGEDLGKVVARGPVPAIDVVSLLMQASSAIDRMHAAGIIHRDLKPENLFITRRDDGSPRLKVLDFGIAKVVEKAAPSATSTRNMGTPVYMSPEQVMGSGNVGPPADLYAVGHLAFTMLVGQPYWLEDALAFETVYPLLLKIMTGASEAASVRALRAKGVTLPAGFDAWFAKATAHAPEDRFRSATASVLALATALDVPRPMLASWPLEQALGLHSDAHEAQAPTDPLDLRAGRESEGPAIPLVPRAPAVPVVDGVSARAVAVVAVRSGSAPGDAPTEPPPPGVDLAPSMDGARPIVTAPAIAVDPAHTSRADAHAAEADHDHDPARAARKEEATRTLSPVSTLPETKPFVAPKAAKPSHRNRLVAIGAAFFLTGVIGSVVLVRGLVQRGGAQTAAPPAGSSFTLRAPPSGGEAPSDKANGGVGAASSVAGAPSAAGASSGAAGDSMAGLASSAGVSEGPGLAPSAGVTANVTGSAAPNGSASGAAVSAKTTVGRPAGTRKTPPSSGKTAPVSTRPYGDPTRDL